MENLIELMYVTSHIRYGRNFLTLYKYGLLSTKVRNIGFDGYIGTWILRIYWIYRRYIGRYFYMNIDISEINKITLKFMEILSKSVKMKLIIKYIYIEITLQ